MDNKKHEMFTKGQVILNVIRMYINEIEKHELYNEQFFIDWEDKLNELSVKEHTTTAIVD